VQDGFFQRLAEGGHASAHLLPAPQCELAVRTWAHGPAQRAAAADIDHGHQMRRARVFRIVQLREVRREHLQWIQILARADILTGEVKLAGGLPQDLSHGRGLPLRQATGQSQLVP